MKVAIVDDDKIIRLGLKKIIARSNEDFEVVGEASNGLDALELLKNTIPDIMITDIKMPIMNGIELINRIKQNKIKCKVIALSGFDEYKFVRESLKGGAVDYLLKPIDNKELIESLCNIKKQIEDEKKILLKYRNLIETSKTIVNEKNLQIMLSEETDSKNKNYHFEDSKLTVISLRVLDENISNILENLKISILKRINSIAKNTIITKFEDNLVILHKKSIEHELLNLLQSLSTDNDIIFSSEYVKENSIKEIYDKCLCNLSRTFYGENNMECLFIEDFTESAELNNIVNAFVDNFNILNINKIYILFDKLVSLFKENHIAAEGFKKYLVKIIDICKLKINDFNKIYESIHTEKSIDLCDYIYYMKDLTKGKDHILSVFGIIINEMKKVRSVRSDRIIECAKDYIQKNYNKSLTLSDVANTVYLNPNYLSELFKKEVGKNFIDYLVELRINAAKELLKTPGIKIYSVANEVGYKEQVSFNRAFKRIVGMSPREYINLIK